MGFVASIAIGEAIGDLAKGRSGKVSFFYCFEAKMAALASAPDLFFEDAPPRVFTILEV